MSTINSADVIRAAASVRLGCLMKVCRQNPKVKNLSNTGEFRTALELLKRLRQRYYTVDGITKAAHMLQYYVLKQKESESGADFVDIRTREYLALRDMGLNVDDSIRLTKFKQRDTINSSNNRPRHTLPLGLATFTFETYNPHSTSNNNIQFCRYCPEKDTRPTFAIALLRGRVELRH